MKLTTSFKIFMTLTLLLSFFMTNEVFANGKKKKKKGLRKNTNQSRCTSLISKFALSKNSGFFNIKPQNWHNSEITKNKLRELIDFRINILIWRKYLKYMTENRGATNYLEAIMMAEEKSLQYELKLMKQLNDIYSKLYIDINGESKSYLFTKIFSYDDLIRLSFSKNDLTEAEEWMKFILKYNELLSLNSIKKKVLTKFNEIGNRGSIDDLIELWDYATTHPMFTGATSRKIDISHFTTLRNAILNDHQFFSSPQFTSNLNYTLWADTDLKKDIRYIQIAAQKAFTKIATKHIKFGKTEIKTIRYINTITQEIKYERKKVTVIKSISEALNDMIALHNGNLIHAWDEFDPNTGTFIQNLMQDYWTNL